MKKNKDDIIFHPKWTVASVNWKDAPWWFVICMALYWLFIPIINPILIILSKALNREINFISYPTKTKGK